MGGYCQEAGWGSKEGALRDCSKVSKELDGGPRR